MFRLARGQVSAASVRFLFSVTFRAVKHYNLDYVTKKEAVQNSVCLGLDKEIADSNVQLYKTGP